MTWFCCYNLPNYVHRKPICRVIRRVGSDRRWSGPKLAANHLPNMPTCIIWYWLKKSQFQQPKGCLQSIESNHCSSFVGESVLQIPLRASYNPWINIWTIVKLFFAVEFIQLCSTSKSDNLAFSFPLSDHVVQVHLAKGEFSSNTRSKRTTFVWLSKGKDISHIPDQSVGPKNPGYSDSKCLQKFNVIRGLEWVPKCDSWKIF